MPFVKHPSLQGRVWEPEPCGPRKHDCEDCFACQMCSDERCRACLAGKQRPHCTKPRRPARAAKMS
ncbi:MAG: hypothetical protein JXB04_06000 [Kiritimatiellae bacterium]|nr:hypothetical protein [Kiritimatiellia bacterium]